MIRIKVKKKLVLSIWKTVLTKLVLQSCFRKHEISNLKFNKIYSVLNFLVTCNTNNQLTFSWLSDKLQGLFEEMNIFLNYQSRILSKEDSHVNIFFSCWWVQVLWWWLYEQNLKVQKVIRNVFIFLGFFVDDAKVLS